MENLIQTLIEKKRQEIKNLETEIEALGALQLKQTQSAQPAPAQTTSKFEPDGREAQQFFNGIQKLVNNNQDKYSFTMGHSDINKLQHCINCNRPYKPVFRYRKSKPDASVCMFIGFDTAMYSEVAKHLNDLKRLHKKVDIRDTEKGTMVEFFYKVNTESRESLRRTQRLMANMCQYLIDTYEGYYQSVK